MKLIAACCALSLLAGCASEPKTVPEVTLSGSPSWYLKPPVEDGVLFAAGMSVSNDLQFAMDKAVLTAKVTLADRITSKVNALTKIHKAEHGAGVTASAERTVKNIIADADVTGYEMTEAVVLPIGNAYRAYVLIKYVPTKDSDVAKAFQELDQETGVEDPPPPAAAPRQKVIAVPM